MALTSLASAGSCTPLPDDDAKNDGTKEPERRRDAGADENVIAKKDDPCAKKSSSSATTQKQRSGATASGSKVLFNNDFESPNVPPDPKCGGGRLDQLTGINKLFGTPDFQFAQFETVEAVMLRDMLGSYTDPSGKGGRFAIGMLSTIQDDKLALAFTTDMPIVNVRLDLSGVAIKDCGTPVSISQPKLRVSLYDGTIDTEALAGPLGEPLDTAMVEGNEVEDAWELDWRTAVAALDATGASDGKVSIVFDLIEGGYAAIDNLSVVASNEKNITDSDTNGVADDVQCSGASTGEGVGGEGGDDASVPRDAGTRSDAGAPAVVDASAPAATPPAQPATPTAPPAPPARPATPTPTDTPRTPPAMPTVRDAGTRTTPRDTERPSESDDSSRDSEDEDQEEEEEGRGGIGGIIDSILGR